MVNGAIANRYDHVFIARKLQGITPVPPRFIPLLERRVKRWLAAGVGPAWVVAVSGGSDSVGLLRGLHAVAKEAGLTLSVAHLDHGVRGDAARADAAFVAELAATLGLPFDLGRWQSTRRGHFETDARRARYAWLFETAKSRGASVVAVGHTRDDQAETILHRILRGSGPRGLGGIPMRRSLGEAVTLLRPLLTVSRGEIRDYLEQLGQAFCDDATNTDLSHTRARIRHDLLPKLAQEYNPKIAEALVRLGVLTSAANRVSQERILGLGRDAAVRIDEREAVFQRQTLERFPTFVRAEVLRLAWRKAGWPERAMTAARWRGLARLVRNRRDGRIDVGEGIVALTNTSMFILRHAEGRLEPAFASIRPESLPLDLPGSVAWRDGMVVATLDAEAPRDETIDLDRVVCPLLVRAPLPGDRFDPLGMGGHEQSLNDFFRGVGIPREERRVTPLVCDRVGIVWVVGHRVADRVRLTDSTTRKVGLRCVRVT